MKLDIEKVRLALALDITDTPHTVRDGLSSVTAEKLQRTIDEVVAAYALPTSPEAASIYTDRYLPPLAERMPPPRGN
jgi:NitT/TauT family transport system substrate-binding protein